MKKNILYLILVLAAFTSCKKDILLNNPGISDFSKAIAAQNRPILDGYIYIESQSNGIEDCIYRVSASFFSAPAVNTRYNERVDVGKIVFNGQEVPKNEPYFDYGNTPNPIPFLKPLNGQMIHVQVDGNVKTNHLPIDTMVYMPQELKLTKQLPKHLNKNGFTLNWIPDTKFDGELFLRIHYYSNLPFWNSTITASLPNKDIEWMGFVKDNGTFTVNSAILNDFPMGGRIEIILYRPNGIQFKKGTKIYQIWAFSNAHSYHILDATD